MRIREMVSDKMKLIIALICLQLSFAGFHIVSRVALNMGVSKVVFPVYRNALAVLILGPFAYFFEKKDRPPLTFSLLFRFFLLALIGITANQGFYLLGLCYATPTFASATQNSVPAITFVMASALGLEQVNLFQKDGLAKVLGTLVSIVGATIITLYKGTPLFHKSLNVQATMDSQDEMASATSKTQNWTLGCLYLLGHCLSWAGWMVLQAPILKKYPAKLSLTSFTCFFGLLQFLVIALFVEVDLHKWKITSSEELFTILYAGIVVSGVGVYLQIWCVDKGGPVFIAAFQPLQTLLVAIMSVLILGDQLYSGRIIGAVFIMLGLYFVLWGKNKERKAKSPDQDQDQDQEPLTRHLLGDEGQIEQNGSSV